MHGARYYLGCRVQYMKWAGIPASKEDTFWTNPTVRNLIKNDYKVLVTRKNTFNGKLYGEDNTIFAWDIYNVRFSYASLSPCRVSLNSHLDNCVERHRQCKQNCPYLCCLSSIR